MEYGGQGAVKLHRKPPFSCCVLYDIPYGTPLPAIYLY